jgi:predicted RNase H-like HicB family nuclease
MAEYIALLRKDRKSDWGVDFPDFPGCVAAAKSREEARHLAVEALQFHIDGMLEDGEEIPDPSTLDEIMADASNRRAVAFAVGVPDPTSRAVRVNITLPKSDLLRIDAYARRLGLTRSRLLLKGAKSLLSAGRLASSHQGARRRSAKTAG